MLNCPGMENWTGCACCGSRFDFLHAAMAPASSSFPSAANLEALPGLRRTPVGGEIIVDCHGHYTTEPQELLDWRKRQIVAIGDRSQVPTTDSLKISDDRLRESVEGAQLRLQRERATSLTLFSPGLPA